MRRKEGRKASQEDRQAGRKEGRQVSVRNTSTERAGVSEERFYSKKSSVKHQ